MASQRVGVHLDFQKQQIQNAVVQPLAAPPSSPVAGQIYYDTSLSQFGVYNGSTWVYLAPGGTDTEAVQDIVAGLLTPGTVITATYNDPANTLTLGIGTGVITDANISSSAAISADKTASGTTNKVYTAAEQTKLAGIASGATNYTDTNARANRLDQFAAPTAAVAFNAQRITGVADPSAAQDAATKNYVDTGNTTQSTADRARANHTGTQTASTISDFDTQVRTSRLDQLAAPTAAVPLNGQRITGLADPTASTDAATKQYVDATAVGIDFKPSVRALAGTNINLASPGTTIGGVTMATGDRFLANAQTTASQNGIYVFQGSAAAATRSTDADTSAEVTSGMLTFVEEGTGAGQQWILTTTGAIVLNTTALTFTQFSGASTVTAGAGLTATGNVFNVGAGTGITVAADSVALDTTVAVRKFGQTIGDGTTTAFALTHALGTQDITVAIRDTATNELVLAQIVATSTTVATITFNVAPATGAYRVTIHG